MREPRVRLAGAGRPVGARAGAASAGLAPCSAHRTLTAVNKTWVTGTGGVWVRARAAAACGRVTHLVSRRLERVRLGLLDHLAAQVLGLALHEPRVEQARQLAQLRPVRAIGRLQRGASPAEGRRIVIGHKTRAPHSRRPRRARAPRPAIILALRATYCQIVWYYIPSIHDVNKIIIRIALNCVMFSKNSNIYLHNKITTLLSYSGPLVLLP